MGNGERVRFWEVKWLGSASLAILFFGDVYNLVNEKSATIATLWDGVNLRCTFRR